MEFHSARPFLLKHWLKNHLGTVLLVETNQQKTIWLLMRK